jgi:hypothetical protein
MPLPWLANRGQIAQIVIAASALFVSVLNSWQSLKDNQFFQPGFLVPLLVSALLVAFIWQLVRQRSYQLPSAEPPKIALLDAHPHQTPPPASYPLKYRIKMRNDSSYAVDVQVSRYLQEVVPLKRFVTDVLQIKLGKAMQPERESVERVAVLPGQQFQAWIGVDETKFDVRTLDALKGRVGTLVLAVNGREIEMKF